MGGFTYVNKCAPELTEGGNILQRARAFTRDWTKASIVAIALDSHYKSNVAFFIN